MNKSKTVNSNRPQIGQRMKVRGVECEIVKVETFGTVQVISLDGKHAWTVSGLAFI